MNFKTFVFMILTFRRVDPIPKNIGLMLSITFWISIVWIISNFAILIMRLIKKHEEEMRFCREFNDLRCEMLIDMAKKIEEYLLQDI